MSNKVSFIIPTYNSEKYISETIDSVINDSYENFEIIVVDDGSIDCTLDILKKYSEKYENILYFTHPNNENRGVFNTRKLGCANATGVFIRFLDSDDILVQGSTKKLVSVLNNNDDCILAHSAITTIGETDEKPEFENNFNFEKKDFKYEYKKREYFLKSNKVCNSSVMIKSIAVNYFNNIDLKQIFQTEDWFLWVLLSQYGKFYFISEPLLLYRYHIGSATAKVNRNQNVYGRYTKIEFYNHLLLNIKDKLIIEKIEKEYIFNLIQLYEEYNTSEKDLKRKINQVIMIKQYNRNYSYLKITQPIFLKFSKFLMYIIKAFKHK